MTGALAGAMGLLAEVAPDLAGKTWNQLPTHFRHWLNVDEGVGQAEWEGLKHSKREALIDKKNRVAAAQQMTPRERRDNVEKPGPKDACEECGARFIGPLMSREGKFHRVCDSCAEAKYPEQHEYKKSHGWYDHKDVAGSMQASSPPWYEGVANGNPSVGVP